MPTPYEIRESLLSRATDYLTSRFHSQLQLADMTQDKEAMKLLKYPTTDEIIALAKTYKDFVDSK